MTHFSERPCADKGLISYRARSAHGGFIMIGARDDQDAANDAGRSCDGWHSLEVWSDKEQRYIPT